RRGRGGDRAGGGAGSVPGGGEDGDGAAGPGRPVRIGELHGVVRGVLPGGEPAVRVSGAAGPAEGSVLRRARRGAGDAGDAGGGAGRPRDRAGPAGRGRGGGAWSSGRGECEVAAA